MISRLNVYGFSKVRVLLIAPFGLWYLRSLWFSFLRLLVLIVFGRPFY